MTLAEGFQYSSKGVAVSIIISCCELLYLAGRGEFRHKGLWSWHVIHAANAGRLSWTDYIYRHDQTIVVVLLGRVLAALGLGVYDFGTSAFILCMLVVVISQFLLNVRIVYGDDGSDQMTTVVTAGIFAACLVDNEWTRLIAAYFISVQLILSYFCSGAAKLFGPRWRSGAALAAVMNHYSYGNRSMSNFLNLFPFVGRVLTFGVIAFQLVFPLSVFSHGLILMLFLAAGFAFHLSIAVIMRLNGFLFAFVSAYPVYYSLLER